MSKARLGFDSMKNSVDPRNMVFDGILRSLSLLVCRDCHSLLSFVGENCEVAGYEMLVKYDEVFEGMCQRIPINSLIVCFLVQIQEATCLLLSPLSSFWHYRVTSNSHAAPSSPFFDNVFDFRMDCQAPTHN